MDPDCCLQSSCQNQPYCRGLPDPQDIISQSLQTPSQQAAKSFYDRISFLIGSDSTHVLPGESPFNKRLMLAFLIRVLRTVLQALCEMLMGVFEKTAYMWFFFPFLQNSSSNFPFWAFLTLFTYFVNFNTWHLTGHPVKESINLHLTSWFFFFLSPVGNISESMMKRPQKAKRSALLFFFFFF